MPDSRPRIMGVLNVTPDSFSDGGRHEDPAVAAEAGHAMSAAGAAVSSLTVYASREAHSSVDKGVRLAGFDPVLIAVSAFLGWKADQFGKVLIVGMIRHDLSADQIARMTEVARRIRG
mgnify:CR=1 FL=1